VPDSEAELTLIIAARDLASRVVGDFGSNVAKLGGVAEKAAGRVGAAFSSVKNGVVNGLGNLTETLAQGGGLGDAAFAFGAYMAGQAAESLVGGLLEKMAGSSLIAAIGAPLSAAGSALGGVISAAIPIGMALLPALLVAALIAAVLFLINNPEILNKVAGVAGSIVGGIIDGLASLGRALLDVFVAAFGLIVNAVVTYITTIVNLWLGLPGKVLLLVTLLPAVIGDALRAVLALAGEIVGKIVGAILAIPTAVKQAIDSLLELGQHLPTPPTGGGLNLPFTPFSGHAAGGWAGLHGPELSWLGEKGPEYVRKAGTGTGDEGGRGFRIVGVSEEDLVDMVQRGLYFRLQRDPPA
jgi:hypothetical protein